MGEPGRQIINRGKFCIRPEARREDAYKVEIVDFWNLYLFLRGRLPDVPATVCEERNAQPFGVVRCLHSIRKATDLIDLAQSRHVRRGTRSTT